MATSLLLVALSVDSDVLDTSLFSSCFRSLANAVFNELDTITFNSLNGSSSLKKMLIILFY